ncbi:MAG: hypothetical protein ABIR70_08610 [Bryobacteraceae bacterium]
MRPIVCLLLLSITASAQTGSAALFSQVDGMLASLSKITGWKVKRPVPSEILTKAQFTKLVEEGVADSEGSKDTRAAELTLKMFGLVPWDFNLARGSADLIEEQAAAFYDTKKKRLFVLESTANSQEQRLALAHELAHALADQQYNLRKYLEAAKEDDASTARESVIEGQASWLSWAYLAEQSGGRPEVPAALLDELAEVGASGDAYPVLERTPLYLRESLTFPYNEGMRFQDSLYRKIGTAAFDRLFQDPPLSTQEIIHPEAYADAVRPSRPVLPKPMKNMKMLVSGDVGEFDYSAILRQVTTDDLGRKVAAEWRGGSYGLYEHKATKSPYLVHVSEWSSPEAARDFFRLYEEAMRTKWKRMDVRTSSDSEITGSGDPGDFVLRISGASVQSFEGIPVK